MYTLFKTYLRLKGSVCPSMEIRRSFIPGFLSHSKENVSVKNLSHLGYLKVSQINWTSI